MLVPSFLVFGGNQLRQLGYLSLGLLFRYFILSEVEVLPVRLVECTQLSFRVVLGFNLSVVAVLQHVAVFNLDRAQLTHVVVIGPACV